jgi:xanthine dehydrogenase accessory factor
MRTVEMLSRVDGLRSGRTPFVLATVVRAERPTSAKPGDCAVVLADGTIDGFVGGVCAESTVRLESLRLLQAGESGLLRITPHAGSAEPVEEGVRTVGNPCLSGGTLEIFLEAVIPPTLVTVYGEAPVARALLRVGSALDYDVRAGGPEIAPDTSAVVVASHGRDETGVLRAALAAGVDYVALVASRRRAAGVLDELAALGVPESDRVRIHAPAGLDIGARTAPEIALSVFADIVAHRPRVHLPDPPELHTAEPAVATDPVCGMSVAVTPAGISAQHAGTTTWFCGTGCRQAFLDDPARFG